MSAIFTSRRPILFSAILWSLFATALLLRLALIMGGVQDTPDDIRYLRALVMINERSFLAIGGMTDHLGFTLFSLPVSSLQIVTYGLAGPPLSLLFWVPASVFALASAANVALIARLARRFGASVFESAAAGLLALLSPSLLIWVNFTLPYDLSLCLALSGILVALPTQRRLPEGRAFLGGLLIALSFLTYNAHWLLCGVAGLVVIVMMLGPSRLVRLITTPRLLHLRGKGGVRAGLPRMWGIVFLSLGAAAPFILLTALTRGAFLTGIARFSDSVTQGQFNEGATLIVEWLAASEGAGLVIWSVGVGAAVWAALQTRSFQHRRRALLWAGMVALILIGLIAGSVILQRFVVYGRTARQIVPFVILLAAFGLARLPGRWRTVALAATVLLNLPGLIAPFGFPSPREVEAGLCVEGYRFARASTVQRTEQPTTIPNARYLLVNSEILYPVKGLVPAPEGEIVFSAPNLYQYVPFQYEGHTPAERALLRQADLRILLVDTGREIGDTVECPP